MAKVHAAGLVQIKEAEVTALCDTSMERIAVIKEALPDASPAVYSDYRELLSDKYVDAVLVALPNFLHLEAGLAILESGKHILMEKPMGRNTEECDALINKAEEKGLVLQSGMILRYSPVYKAIEEHLAMPDAGKPSIAWVNEFRSNFPHRWRYSQELSGGALVEKCCHHFDLFNWWVGELPESIMATGGQNVIKNGEKYHVYCPPTEEFDIDDTTILDHAAVNINYPGGAKANLLLSLHLSFDASADGYEAGIATTAGKRLVTNGKQLTAYGFGDAKHTVEVDSGEGKDLMLLDEDREFVQSILQGRKPFTDGRVGRDSVRVGELAEISIARGGEKIPF
jgi:predicted dehydrogenase